MEQSTLTGAAVSMMHHDQCPFWCNDQGLAEVIRKCSLEAFEPAWHMPLTLTSEKGIKHEVADTNNITSKRPNEGASSAANFLFNAIKNGTKYAHIDIAAATAKGDFELNKCHPNGFGTGILVHLIEKLKDGK